MIFQSRINRFVVCFLFNIFIYLSRESYNAVASWLSDARTLASPNIVIILCGNKKDLEDQRQVTFVEASRFAQENGKIYFYLKRLKSCVLFKDLIFLETSAMTSENVTEGFLKCARVILSKIDSGN
jgi:GTPase SAR1 family protein